MGLQRSLCHMDAESQQCFQGPVQLFPRSRLCKRAQRGSTQNPKALTYGADTSTASWSLAEQAWTSVITPQTSTQEQNLLKFNHNAEKGDGIAPHLESAYFPCLLLGHCSDSQVLVHYSMIIQYN